MKNTSLALKSKSKSNLHDTINSERFVVTLALSVMIIGLLFFFILVCKALIQVV